VKTKTVAPINGEDDATVVAPFRRSRSACGQAFSPTTGTLWRRPGLPGGIKNWSLTSLQQRTMKTRGQRVKHAKEDGAVSEKTTRNDVSYPVASGMSLRGTCPSLIGSVVPLQDRLRAL
jgi:hypothetical protein